MSRLVLDLIRPYRGWLAIVFVAMLVEIGTGLAAPWPLEAGDRRRARQPSSAALARMGA